MAKKTKKYALRANQIKPLAENNGGCIATDMITVDGLPVGYMFRDSPHNEMDSGWQFMSGKESQAYMDVADHHGIYDVNTIANYDPDIIPYLDAPTGCAFERQGKSKRFVQVEGKAWKPGKKTSGKNWPPPGFPLVKGDHVLNENWKMHLPEEFARRVEEGSLVLWRPGLTIWLAAWQNNRNESQAKRLALFKKTASKKRTEERKSSKGGVTRYSYRLRDKIDDAYVESINAFIISDDGHLQMSVYFDDKVNEVKAIILPDCVIPCK